MDQKPGLLKNVEQFFIKCLAILWIIKPLKHLSLNQESANCDLLWAKFSLQSRNLQPLMLFSARFTLNNKKVFPVDTTVKLLAQ